MRHLEVKASPGADLYGQDTALVTAGQPECLHQLFEHYCRLTPEALALDGPGIRLTYAQLDAQSNRLARELRSQGFGPGAFAGLFMGRSHLQIIAILACLKAGGAYVPLDPGHPDERVAFIIGEAGIRLVLTESALAGRVGGMFSGSCISLDTCEMDSPSGDGDPLTLAETGVTPVDPCYVLYTSGTTGRPKGVVAEHRNVVAFVKAFNKVCATHAQDRIFQGFALTFDGSVEEMWMAFSNGATLVTGDSATPRFGNDLAAFMNQCGITFFSTVPTLLSTITEDIPSLRQLVVSGEACPPELVSRWARSGRIMLNVYGPTEATVNTTAKRLEPGQPVTIGKPLTGYELFVLDSDFNRVADGDKGELFVGGPTISRGYLNQPEQTAKSYLDMPQYGGRLYRTGDSVRLNSDGELEFFGRIDSQVKVRGFRVELAEIEEVLLAQNGIASAAVRVVERQATQTLAAYVVPDSGASINRGAVLAALRSRLPDYMVPAYLDVLPSLPMLASGKVDRKQLPEPKDALSAERGADDLPASPLEEKIAGVWADLFQIPHVGATQDFFRDLGGHSLLAAQLVTRLRESLQLHVPVRAIYSYPTVRQLAGHVARMESNEVQAERASRAVHHAAELRQAYRKPGAGMIAVQLIYLLLLGPLLALPMIIVVPPVIDMLYFRKSILDTFIFLIVVGLVLWPLFLALGLSAKWILIGRYKSGAYPLWSGFYLRWWLASRLQALSGLGVFGGTPLAPVMWRLMGAKVGRNCMLQTGLVSAWDCISIGYDTSIGADTQLPGVRVENGYLLVGSVDIGSRCFVGSHSSLGLDVRIGDDGRLDDQSSLPDGAAIEAGESWRGSPAAPAIVPVPEGEPLRRSRGYLALFCAGQVLAGIILALLFGLPFLALGLGVAFMIVHASAAIWIPVTLALVPLSIVVSCFYAALTKKIIQPDPQPGTFALYSFVYLQYWLTSGLMRAVRGAGLLIFTTIYLPPWMRLLGAKLGRHTEMSTVWSFYPDMLEAGDGVFFADGCLLGGSRTHLGRLAMMKVTIGNRSFIGNSAYLPAGSGLGDNCLLGVLSLPPEAQKVTPDNSDWLGSPGFLLPNRHKVGGFDEATTYEPTRSLYMQRAVIDALRILVPAYLAAVLGAVSFLAVLALYNAYGVWAVYFAAPLMGWAGMAIAVAVTVGLKRMVMGTFHPVVVPLWSRYVWLNEFINGVYEVVMSPVVGVFYGTPFAAPLLRLIGCDIGKHCYIASSLFSEFDLVHIGDYAALNGGSIIQNHLFEDRIMKSSHLHIGRGCTVGNMAVVLYDTRMEEGAVLGPLSLLMKGETMPAGARWQGIPTVQD